MQKLSTNFFDQILANPSSRQHYNSLTQWHQHYLNITKHLPSTLEQATLGGYYSTNMSYAFSAGYQSAIQSLFKPEVRRFASLCVTEKDGNLPKNIKSTLVKHNLHWQLNGSKSFITGANEAEHLYIAVTENDSQNKIPNERPTIKMLSVPTNTQGIEINPMPNLPFVPDLKHGTASFKHVDIQVAQILAGDGHSQYVKPFRTHEDIHVLAAILGFRIGEALNAKWSQNSIEAHLTLLSSVLSLEPDNFNDATTHLIFSGCKSQFNALVKTSDEEFELNNNKGFNDWKRDKALLDIASKAHKVRTQRAWSRIFS